MDLQKKDLHVNKIKKYSYKKKEVFIGDALSDRDAARDNDIFYRKVYNS